MKANRLKLNNWKSLSSGTLFGNLFRFVFPYLFLVCFFFLFTVVSFSVGFYPLGIVFLFLVLFQCGMLVNLIWGYQEIWVDGTKIYYLKSISGWIPFCREYPIQEISSYTVERDSGVPWRNVPRFLRNSLWLEYRIKIKMKEGKTKVLMKTHRSEDIRPMFEVLSNYIPVDRSQVDITLLEGQIGELRKGI